MRDIFVLINISILSLSSLIFIVLSAKILFLKKKDAVHWVFLAISILFLLRIVSYDLLVYPGFNKSLFLGLLLYRIQTISVFFYPALFANLFYLLLCKNNKRYLTIIIILYFLSFLFYLSALIGFNPVTRDLKIENNKIRFIINTSSYIYKTVIFFFIFSYAFSIYLLSKFSKIKMINKDRKTINIMKWTYIFTFGYGYIFQFILSMIQVKFVSLTHYLITIFSMVIYYTITRYNFLKIYQTTQFTSLINKDFSLPFIITDENGVIMKSNFKSNDDEYLTGKNINSVFTDSPADLSSILETGTAVKNMGLKFVNPSDHIELLYTVDVNVIKDKFNDVLGLFIVLSDYKVLLNSFSLREQEIINYLRAGFSYKAIAYALKISYNTVNTHIKNIYKKSGVNEKKELLESLN